MERIDITDDARALCDKMINEGLFLKVKTEAVEPSYNPPSSRRGDVEAEEGADVDAGVLEEAENRPPVRVEPGPERKRREKNESMRFALQALTANDAVQERSEGADGADSLSPAVCDAEQSVPNPRKRAKSAHAGDGGAKGKSVPEVQKVSEKEELSDYELKRLATIAANKKKLAAIAAAVKEKQDQARKEKQAMMQLVKIGMTVHVPGKQAYLDLSVSSIPFHTSVPSLYALTILCARS